MEKIREFLDGTSSRFLIGTLILIGSIVMVIVIYRLVIKWLTKRAEKTENKIDDYLIEVLKMPFLFILIFTMFRIFSQTVFFDTRYFDAMNHAIKILFIITVGWIFIKGVRVMFRVLEGKAKGVDATSAQARGSLTKFSIFEKLITGLLVIITVAVCLMTFPQINNLGKGLLASAGVAGIIGGLSAQKSLASVFTGLQIAITQPIKLGDVIVINGLNGTVEEIGLTYVVMRLWNERRVIIPISKFLDDSFENWTRNSSKITGTVHFFVDYSLPLDAFRTEVDSYLKESTKWDKRKSQVQVIDMTSNYMEVRVVVTSSDSLTLISLQMNLREHMIKFIQTNYPDCFVKIRNQNIVQHKERTS